MKMEGIEKNPNVCFLVDESFSDVFMYKSVVIKGIAKVIDDEDDLPCPLWSYANKWHLFSRSDMIGWKVCHRSWKPFTRIMGAPLSGPSAMLIWVSPVSNRYSRTRNLL